MAMSRIEYYRSVLDHIVKVAGVELSNEQRNRPAWDELRRRIERVPGERLLTAGVADFWLDLGTKLGRRRRQDPSIPSPFWPDGKKIVAKKAPIAAWHDAWSQREAAKFLADARTPTAKALHSSLTEVASPWLMGWVGSREVVVGHASWLPSSVSEESFQEHSYEYDVRWMRPAQALRMPWREDAEAIQWLEILSAAHRVQEAELEAVRLQFNTALLEK